ESLFVHNDRSGSLFCSGNSYSARHNNKETAIPAPSSGSSRVGVYLDWPAGTLSFYFNSVSHSHTHTHSLTSAHTCTEDTGTHTQARTHTHTHTHTHTYTHTHRGCLSARSRTD